MTKKTLLLSILASCAMLPAVAKEVKFNFQDPTSIQWSPMSLSELRTETFQNEGNGKTKERFQISGKNYLLIITDETMTVDGVEMTLVRTTGSSYPRLFWAPLDSEFDPNNPGTVDETDFLCDVRWYAGTKLTVTAPAGMKIDEIVMLPKSASNNTSQTIVQTEGGTQEIASDNSYNKWTANEGSSLSEVVFQAQTDCATQVMYSLTATISSLDGSAVNEIEAAENASVEYYNLAGVRCNSENLAPGVYVRKAGNKVSKVIVK